MKQAVLAVALLLLPAAAVRESPHGRDRARSRHQPPETRQQHRRAPALRTQPVAFPVNVTASAPPENPAVNETNMLAQQSVTFFTQEDCVGQNATFHSSGNEFMAEFASFAKNLWSVKFCGKGTFFYYSSPDMQLLSLLGHFTRCSDTATKSMQDCECTNMRPEVRKLVESFVLQYC